MSIRYLNLPDYNVLKVTLEVALTIQKTIVRKQMNAMNSHSPMPMASCKFKICFSRKSDVSCLFVWIISYMFGGIVYMAYDVIDVCKSCSKSV